MKSVLHVASGLAVLLALAGPGAGGNGPACPRGAERSFALGGVTEITERNPRCRIEFQKTGIRLEAIEDGSRPDPGRTVLVDSNGRFISANAPGFRTAISVWDARGRYLYSFGREGEGPGELSTRGSLSLFIDSRDNVHVRDGSPSWSVFSSSHEFLRRVPSDVMVGLPGSTAILDDGSALASTGRRSDRVAHDFRLADTMGALLRTFGTVRDKSGNGPRQIAYVGGDTFWAGPPEGTTGVYILEEWGIDGKLRRTLRRSVAWYRWRGGRETSSAVRQLYIGPGGILYVLIVRPTEQYARAVKNGERISGERRDALTEVVVEVIDTRASELLASEVYPAREARQFLPRSLFRGSLVGYRYGEGEDGLPFVEIVRVELLPQVKG